MRLFDKLNRFLEDNNYEIILRDNWLNIINYSEIVDFSLRKIIVKCNNSLITVDGINLTISKMLDNELLIIGNITNISIN